MFVKNQNQRYGRSERYAHCEINPQVSPPQTLFETQISQYQPLFVPSAEPRNLEAPKIALLPNVDLY